MELLDMDTYGAQLFVYCALLVITLALSIKLSRAHKRMKHSNIPHPPVEFFLGNARELIQEGLTKCHQKWMIPSRKLYSVYFGMSQHIVLADLDAIKRTGLRDFRSTTMCNLYSKAIKFEAVLGCVSTVGINWLILNKSLSENGSIAIDEDQTSQNKMRQLLVSHFDASCSCLVDEVTEFVRLRSPANFSRIFAQFGLQSTMSLFIGRELNILAGATDELSDTVMQLSSEAFSNTPLPLSILASNFPKITKPLLKLVTKQNIKWQKLNCALQLVKNIMTIRKFNHRVLKYEDLLESFLETHFNEDVAMEEFCQSWFGLFLTNYVMISNVLAYTAYLLALNQDKQKKLTNLIDEFFIYNEKASTYEASQSIQYLDCVVLESMRLYSPNAWMAMHCTQSTMINDVQLQEGMTVVIPIQAIHRSTDYWSNPETFNPDRFSRCQSSDSAASSFVHLLAKTDFSESVLTNECTLVGVKMALVSILTYFHFVRIPTTTVPLKTDTHTIFGNIQIPVQSIILNLETN